MSSETITTMSPGAVSVAGLSKPYYSISEVSSITQVKPHVLRYWETQFPMLKPRKNRAGNNVTIGLFKAYDRLVSEYADTLDQAIRQNLEALIAKLGLSDRVEMLGNLSEERYLEEMKRADIFVLASHGEPMGVVYMEAQAMEVPAIGCNALGAK